MNTDKRKQRIASDIRANVKKLEELMVSATALGLNVSIKFHADYAGSDDIITDGNAVSVRIEEIIKY